MYFNMTEAVPILKEVVLPGVREFMQHATILLSYIERKTQPNSTGTVEIVYHKSGDNNAGTGAGRTDDYSDVVSPGKQTFGRVTIGTKQLYKRVRWTGKVIAATRSNKDALIDAILSETEYGVKDFKTSVNRQLNGDERDALGFYVSGAGTATAVVTDEWGNVGADLFRSGETRVDLINGSTHAVRQSGIYATRSSLVATGRQLTLKDSSGASLNLSGSATDGDYFVLAGAMSATSVSEQLMGIRGIVSAGNPPLRTSTGLQGTLVADVPEFAATIVGSDGSTDAATDWVDLRFENMQRVLSEIDIVNDDPGSGGIDLIYTSPAGYDTYVKMCKDERITVNQMTLDGGFTGVSFNGNLPLVKDKHARKGAFFFLNFDSLGLFQLADIDWADLHGSMFEKIPNKDAYESMLFQYAELGTTQRNANGALVGIKMLY
jgi:hypothetical protein